MLATMTYNLPSGSFSLSGDVASIQDVSALNDLFLASVQDLLMNASKKLDEISKTANQDVKTMDLVKLGSEMKDGKYYYRGFGKEGSPIGKFGCRVWDEVLTPHDAVFATLKDKGIVHFGADWRADVLFESGKPIKIVAIYKAIETPSF
jgi:hypothetical protein